MSTEEKTLAERVKIVEKENELDIPWEVKRAFPQFQMWGSQFSLCDEGDFLSIEDLKEVSDWLAKQVKPTPAKLLIQNFPKITLKGSNLTKEQKKQLRKAVKEEVKECLEHFQDSEWGWPLDYQAIREQILHTAFGMHLSDYLLSELLRAGMAINYENGKCLIEMSEEEDD